MELPMFKLNQLHRSENVGTLLRGLAAYGLAELSVRLVRLAAVILIARQLAPDVIGPAALTLTLFEVIRTLANIGVGQQIIAAKDSEISSITNGAHRLFWMWCGGVAVFQLLVALVLWYGFSQTLAAQMLAALSLVYFFMPGGLVQCYLLMRGGKAGSTARIAATQTISDHVLTAVLLLIWPNPWSIVLPKLLTAPIWLILMRRSSSWRPDPLQPRHTVSSLMSFGLSVLATDLTIALRNQADKLIVSATFGVTALGTYFFAFNAGIGIVSSLIAAFGTVVFPSLTSVPTGRARALRLKQALALGLLLFVPVITAQAALANIYVPIVFGDHWAHAAPLVSVLCLAGLPMLLSTAVTAWLRAEGRPHLDAIANLGIGLAALSGLAIGATYGSLEAAACGWVIGQSLIAIPFAWHVLKRATTQSHTTLSKGAVA
jgi:lipopolysaccharide exporter